MFSQLELVGVKCKTNRGWASSHFLTAGVLCVELLPNKVIFEMAM